MKILFVSAVMPWPLYSGGQIRMYNLLKALSVRHEITLVSFIRDTSEREYKKNLSFCRNVEVVMRGRAWLPTYIWAALTGKYPWLLATYDNTEMRQLISDLLKGGPFDVVHIEPFYVLPALPTINTPLVISEHNIEYDVYGAYADLYSGYLVHQLLARDVDKLKKWEHTAWRAADKLTAVSKEDAAVMEEYLSHPVTVVPNGVDGTSFPYRKVQKNVSPVVLFTGNFRWLPNRQAAEVLVSNIWPGIRARFPQSKLLVVGRDIPKRLSARVRVSGGEAREHVENIAEVYAESDVLVAPHAISGGTKFKMLEAMASGVPVVTTPQGMSGLEVTAGIHYFEAETPEEFIAQVGAVWDNTKLTLEVTAKARARVIQQYSWDHIAKALEGVWKEAYAKK